MGTGIRQRAHDNAVFPKDHFLTVSDGTRIAYTVVGKGDAIPIVFVNGWTCSDAYWVGIGPRLVEGGHPCVYLDTRAHGESGLPRAPGLCARNLQNEDVEPRRLALDVVEVLEEVGIDRAVFAGHSMGVQTIIEIYRQAPLRVAGLIPVAGTFENPIKTFANLALLDRLYPIAEVLFKVTPFEAFQPFMRRAASPSVGHKAVRLIRVGGPKVREEDLAPHMAQIGDVNFSVLFRMMSELRRHQTRDLLPKITVPVMVLAGRKDVFTPPSVQDAMGDLIPNCEVVWFDEAGHMLPIEEPEGVVDAMLRFVTQLQ